jgi:hypothetical protein
MKVTYKIRAKLGEAGKVNKSQLKPLEFKRRVIIRQPALEVKQFKTILLEKNIKTWGFWNRGASKVEVTFDKDAYSPDETLHATCMLDN